MRPPGGSAVSALTPASLERAAVYAHHVAGVVHEAYGVVGRRAVEVVAGGVAHVSDACVVVACAAHPVAGRGLGGALADAGDDVIDGAVRRRACVDLERGGGEPDHVIVRLDEAGEESAAARVDHGGV